MPRYEPNAHQLPSQLEDEDEEHGSIDPHDDADYRSGNEPDQPVRAGVQVSVLEDFIKQLEMLDEMTAPDIANALDGLPVPVESVVEGIPVREAIEVCYSMNSYIEFTT